MPLTSEEEKWFEGKFSSVEKKIQELIDKASSIEIKADKSLTLARAMSKKVLD